MIKVVAPKEYLTQEQLDFVTITLAKIEEIMCEFAMLPCMDRNGMTALSLSLTHLALAPMVELDKEMVEVFFAGMLAGDMPESDKDECIRGAVSSENLN